MRQRIQIGLTDRQKDRPKDRLASQTERHEAGHGQQRISSCCSSRPDVFFSHISVRFLWHNVDSPVEPTAPNPNPSPTPLLCCLIYGMDFFVVADFSLVSVRIFFVRFSERVCRVEKLV